MTRRRSARAILPAAALALLPSACGVAAPNPGRIGSAHRSGTAAIRVVTGNGTALAVAAVTVNGKGPYAFIVDTGASESVLDTAVARAAGITSTTGHQRISAVSCQTTAHTATVRHWQVGNVPLPPDRVSVLPISGDSRGGAGPLLGGLIGSDVLADFGVVGLSYSAGRLELGPKAVTLTTRTATTVPVDVLVNNGAVLATAPVRIDGRGPYPFVVDSGAQSSVVDSTLAHRLRLAAVGGVSKAREVSCQASVRHVLVSHWSVGGAALPAGRLAALPVAGSVPGGRIDGLLGSGTLRAFGTVVLDYRHGRLLLGKPAAAYAGTDGAMSAKRL